MSMGRTENIVFERRYDPFTLKFAQDMLRLRAMAARTRDEKKAAKEAVLKVGFLKSGYRLLGTLRHGPLLIQRMYADMADQLEADIRKTEDDVGPLLEKLMPRRGSTTAGKSPDLGLR